MGLLTWFFCLAFAQIAVGQTSFTGPNTINAVQNRQALLSANARGLAQNSQVARGTPAVNQFAIPTGNANMARANLANSNSASNFASSNVLNYNLGKIGGLSNSAQANLNSNPSYANVARSKMANSGNFASSYISQNVMPNNGNLANTRGDVPGRLANSQSANPASGFSSGNVAGKFDIGGNPFQILSSPGNELRIATDSLEIRGTVSVTGSMPIHGTVSLKGALPTGGAATVNYGCASLPGSKKC